MKSGVVGTHRHFTQFFNFPVIFPFPESPFDDGLQIKLYIGVVLVLE